MAQHDGGGAMKAGLEGKTWDEMVALRDTANRISRITEEPGVSKRTGLGMYSILAWKYAADVLSESVAVEDRRRMVDTLCDRAKMEVGR